MTFALLIKNLLPKSGQLPEEQVASNSPVSDVDLESGIPDEFFIDQDTKNSLKRFLTNLKNSYCFKAINVKRNAILDTYKNLPLPINIRQIAQDLGVKVLLYPLENDFSGILVIEENMEFDPGSEEAIKLLAKKFDVSIPAMYYKILNLK